jgi:hypothetical protein
LAKRQVRLAISSCFYHHDRGVRASSLAKQLPYVLGLPERERAAARANRMRLQDLP